MEQEKKQDKRTSTCYCYTPRCINCKWLVTKSKGSLGYFTECVHGRYKPVTILDKIKNMFKY